MNRATSPTGWVRNPVMISPELDPRLASSYELGYTWNPITGCLNGCDYCYARKLANGRLKPLYLANKNVPPRYQGCGDKYTNPFYPRFWPDRLGEMIPHYPSSKHYKQMGIFVCDMSDLFGIGIPEDWTKKILRLCDANNAHRFYLLTKQPQNLIKFSPFPDNCYVGVTATNQHQFNIALAWLAQIEASLTFISVEPHLEHIKVNASALRGRGFKLGWLIDGAQTKPYKPPKREWVEEIVQACDKAGIPVFLKDNLKPLLCRTVKGHDVIESHNLWAFKYFKLRQEMPEGR